MIYGTFLQSPHLWHLISGSQKTLIFCVFDVSGPFGYQMVRGKMHIHYFIGGKIMGERTEREKPRGPNGHGPCGQGIWQRGDYPLAPWAPFRPLLLTTPLSRQKSGRPNFPKIY
jgi:hypothetical protein